MLTCVRQTTYEVDSSSSRDIFIFDQKSLWVCLHAACVALHFVEDIQIRVNIVDYFLPEASFGLRVLSLPASVCLCVCVSVCPCMYQSQACPHDNSPLVQARITKFGTKLQRPCLRSLLFCGWSISTFKVKFNLKVKILPHFDLVRPITHQLFKLISPNLDRKCILTLLRFLWILD